MPDIHETLAQILGIGVGERNELRRPVADQLKASEVIVNLHAITEWRSGASSGIDTAEQLLCGKKLRDEKLEPGGARQKDEFYARIASVGLSPSIRVGQANERKRHRYNSNGFTRAVANSLLIDEATMRQCLLAMRVDMLLSLEDEEYAETVDTLRQAADTYLDHYTRPQVHTSEAHKQMKRQWDRMKTPQNFYKALYNGLGTRSIGTWVPYEVEVFDVFYRQRADQKHVLTPFDIKTLEAGKDDTLRRTVALFIRDETGVLIDDHGIAHHKNLLIYGKPLPPQE